MARTCTICGKGYLATFTRSHSMRKTKVRLYPNLQWMKLEHGKRVKACVKCMKTRTKRMVSLGSTAESRRAAAAT